MAAGTTPSRGHERSSAGPVSAFCPSMNGRARLPASLMVGARRMCRTAVIPMPASIARAGAFSFQGVSSAGSGSKVSTNVPRCAVYVAMAAATSRSPWSGRRPTERRHAGWRTRRGTSRTPRVAGGCPTAPGCAAGNFCRHTPGIFRRRSAGGRGRFATRCRRAGRWTLEGRNLRGRRACRASRCAARMPSNSSRSGRTTPCPRCHNDQPHRFEQEGPVWVESEHG